MPKLQNGTTLAFDFGETRIGVACGETETQTAHPLQTIDTRSKEQRFAAIARLIEIWQPVQIVVGLPVHSDGTEHELTRMARNFGRRLHRRFGLPVYWADERHSSLYAAELLADGGILGRRQKSVLDQVAAQAILHTAFAHGILADGESIQAT